MAAGTMVVLDGATGNIDTSDQLNMFEAFQKAFVVNGTNLGVADFVNTKLTHSELTTAHTKGDILTQDTDNKMVVDFTNAAMTATYGYVTAGTFVKTTEVTGSGSGSAFNPTAVDDKPHWYSWTVYPGGTEEDPTYGSMPDAGYLGCLYRGRCVIAGNPDYPHQWYMSKVGDPWNWKYSSTDPLTAVAGNNADAGEIGDILRALIPYKDDYLIFGCASTIWVLTGDPAFGGSIDEIDSTVGMFGANSWCFDSDGNLYFFGTAGIYKVPLGFRSIENLTEITLPNLIEDRDADSSTHRITMVYDRKRHGILTCITELANGSNSNYWYDLQLKGFFPENYPDECGPYSSFYYPANENEFADLLIGCKDGYIRKFDESSTGKNDDIGETNSLISSHVTLPIEPLAEDADNKGKLTSLTFELAGGKTYDSDLETGGTFSDTDAVTYEIHVGDDAETVLEDIKESATAFSSGILSNTGRKNRIRTRARGAYLGIKLSNSAASSTFAINKIYGDIKPAGKI